jgi:hypothetical protein
MVEYIKAMKGDENEDILNITSGGRHDSWVNELTHPVKLENHSNELKDHNNNRIMSTTMII